MTMPATKRLAILGASGHGKVVAEIAELNGWQVAFYDDAYPEISKLEHWQVQGKGADLLVSLSDYDGCLVAIGNNRIRLEQMACLQAQKVHFPVLLHPSAVVSHYAQIDDGSVVMANAVVNPFATIGQGCIINTSATIDHDCVLADGVHISPGANLAGAVSVGARSWIGIGASVKQCLSIGSDVTVGAGSVVIEDIADHLTVAGVPAKILSQKVSTSKC